MESNTESAKPDIQPKKTVTIKDINEENVQKEDGFCTKLRSTSTLWKIASILFFIGFLFHVLAYGTPYWINIGDVTGNGVIHIGLWSLCTTISNCSFRDASTECLNSVRGFGGVAVLNCMLIALLLLMYIKQPINRRRLSAVVVTFCTITAISVQIVTTIFGRTFGCFDDVISGSSLLRWSWSLALSFTAVLCISVAAVMFLVQELRTCSRHKSRLRRRRDLGLTIT